MLIEVDIPDMLTRKIKALSVLSGTTSSMDELVISLMDLAVSMRVAEMLGLVEEGSSLDTAPAPAPEPKPKAKQYSYNNYDSDLEDGLGDEDESEPEPVESMYDLLPKGGGLSAKALDDDMSVQDPEHEAKADATSISYPPDSGRPDELFSRMVGLPSMHEESEMDVDPRVLRRKRKLNIKGRVVPATSVEDGF